MLDVVNDRAMRTRAREVLKELQVGIQSVNVSVKGMSGGQRQCLAIARALIWGRRIVILDEPTAALGVRESKQVLDLISRLRDHGVSVILVSHNMQQLVTVADRFTVMRLGRSVATRNVADAHPRDHRGAHHRRDPRRHRDARRHRVNRSLTVPHRSEDPSHSLDAQLHPSHHPHARRTLQ